MPSLHEKYAPILKFNKEEQFYPMRVNDMFDYSSLHLKGRQDPLLKQGELTPARLLKYQNDSEVFIRTVEVGPLLGSQVVDEWEEGALEMVLRWAQEKRETWSSDLTRRVYGWLNPTAQMAGQLFWWNNLITYAVEGALKSTAKNDLPRLTLPAAMRTNAAERYHDSLKKSRAYTYYYRQVKDGDYFSLQYWFFYSYNDWGRGYTGLNDHEGDWEGLMLFFPLRLNRVQEPPAYITYAHHEDRVTYRWDDPAVPRVGTHPIGYVAAGSHATYAQAQKKPVIPLYNVLDLATGDGLTIDQDEWSHCLNLDEIPWLTDYQGSWGTRYWLSTTTARTILQLALGATPLSGLIGLAGAAHQEFQLPGVSAPHGPVDPTRSRTANPVAWAQLPD